MITYDELVKKHYILQTKRVNPFNSEKPFYPFEGFGIECGEGWYDLLDELCTKIEAILDKDERYKKEFKIAQIKEKFGTLRFYTYGHCDNVDKFIIEAENKSEFICEKCGKEGITVSIGHWLHTLCKECGIKRLVDWKKNIINSMAKTERSIQELQNKKDITAEEWREFEDAREWLKIGEENLKYAEEQIKKFEK